MLQVTLPSLFISLFGGVVAASECPSLTYSAIPLGVGKQKVLGIFQAAGCEVRERPKGYPEGLFLIDSEAIQVQSLSVNRSSAVVTCACWAHVSQAYLVFGPAPNQSLYVVERRIVDTGTIPQEVLVKYKTMLDPLLGSPGSPKFQDHRFEGLGL